MKAFVIVNLDSGKIDSFHYTKEAAEKQLKECYFVQGLDVYCGRIAKIRYDFIKEPEAPLTGIAESGLSFDECYEYSADYLQQELGEDTALIASFVPELDGKYYPNFGAIAVQGSIKFVFEGYNEGIIEDWEEFSETLENPTWLDVCKFADRVLRKYPYDCHRYLEGVEPTADPNVYKLFMGS